MSTNKLEERLSHTGTHCLQKQKSGCRQCVIWNSRNALFVVY